MAEEEVSESEETIEEVPEEAVEISEETIEEVPEGAVKISEEVQVVLEGPEEELEKIQAEAKEFKDKYLRALAELENSRKRFAREKIESQSFAIQNVVLDLLQPIDHFEQALNHAEHADATVAHWAKGFEMILQQLKQVLEDHGVTSFTSMGAQFDPHFHEAVETEESEEVAEGTIIFEFHKGYKLGNRTIRAARVRVATQPKNNEIQETKEEQIEK